MRAPTLPPLPPLLSRVREGRERILRPSPAINSSLRETKISGSTIGEQSNCSREECPFDTRARVQDRDGTFSNGGKEYRFRRRGGRGEEKIHAVKYVRTPKRRREQRVLFNVCIRAIMTWWYIEPLHRDWVLSIPVRIRVRGDQEQAESSSHPRRLGGSFATGERLLAFEHTYPPPCSSSTGGDMLVREE